MRWSFQISQAWWWATCVAVLGLALAIPLVAVPVVSADEGYKLPYQGGQSWTITQGWGDGDHTGLQDHAYDFGMPDGTPVLAAKGGDVTFTEGRYSADHCGTDKKYLKQVNFVTIDHRDGSATTYLHLQRVDVSVGQPVVQGQQIGLSGHTGFTIGSLPNGCGPHLHFQRQATGAWFTQSRAVYFDEYPGQQLQRGQSYTSQQNQSGAVTVTGTVREDGRALSGMSVDVRRALFMNDFQFVTTDGSGRYSRSFSQGAGEWFAIAVGENDAHGYLNRNKEFNVQLGGGTHTVDVDLPTFRWTSFNCDKRSNTCSINIQGTGYFPNTVGVTLYAWAVPVAPNLIPLSTVAVDSTGRFNRSITFPRPANGTYTVDAQQRAGLVNPCNCGFLPNAEARPPTTFVVK